MKFTGFFWDFDGTLFDTYPRINRAMQTLAYVSVLLRWPYCKLYFRLDTAPCTNYTDSVRKARTTPCPSSGGWLGVGNLIPLNGGVMPC